MKTSTKIILLFVSLLLAGMLTLYVTTKYRPRAVPINIEWKTKFLEPFSVVVAQNVKLCSLSGDSLNFATWAMQKNGDPILTVRNDTLYIENPKNLNGQLAQIEIKCKSLRSVIANNGSNISLSGLMAGPFDVSGNGSEITINNWYDQSEKPRDRTIDLTVVAENLANVYLRYIHVGKWNVKLNRAKLITFEEAKSQDLKLVLKDHSYAEFQIGPKNITLDRDSTSVVIIH